MYGTVAMECKRFSGMEAERAAGGVFETQVHKKTGFTEEFDGNRRVSVNEVYFAPGERTTVHKHTIRQILYVTGGRGIIASEDERFEVTKGDIISIGPGEEHWHGAALEEAFRHISVVVRDDETGGTERVEEPTGKRSK